MPGHSARFSAVIVGCLLSWASNGAPAVAACLDCHQASFDSPVHAIFATAHGAAAGSGSAACQGCHGDSAQHAASPKVQAPDTSYGPRWQAPAQQRSQTCLSCHNEAVVMHWQGSVHQQEDLSCNDCHVSHRQQDPVTDNKLQAQSCYGCHPAQRMQAKLPSRHPILEGKTSCGSCHNVHAATTAALQQASVNDNCYSCHQEKRGPFLFEHVPVTEDCGNCHTAHGSANRPLLTSRTPFLCQQCHASAYHPSLANSGAGTAAGANPSASVLGKNCMNCHSQVHGSNHPAGARLTR